MTRRINPKLLFKPKMAFDVAEFNKILENGYLATRNDKTIKMKTSFSPSVIGGYHGTCPRYWYLAFTGAEFEDTFDALGIVAMNSGTDAHTRIQKILKDADLEVEAEVEVLSCDPPIRGFVDLVLDWQGTKVVGEIKTTKQESFAHRVGTHKPYKSHYIQILLYMHILEANEGFVLYENKNTGEFVTLPIVMTPGRKASIESVLEWMRGVYSIADGDISPNRVFEKKSYICKKCPVYKHCWKEELSEFVEIPALEVPGP
jgi:CRISPR/Cas system-associated exonuclease Cas4 (RecB family)